MIKKDCFAMKFNNTTRKFCCNALDDFICERKDECPFYTPTTIYNKKLEVVQDRLYGFGNKNRLKKELQDLQEAYKGTF